MLYVSKIDKANSLIHITDTDDGVVNTVTQSQLNEIIKLGVVISGVTYVDGRLCVRVINQVKDIAGLIAKLTAFRNYEEIGRFRFNSEYNICWIFKDSIYDNERRKLLFEKLRHNSGVLFYVLPSVTNIGSVFSGAQVKSLDLSHFDTRNVTDMSGMFEHCAIDNLDLSSFDTSTVTDMNSMFSACGVKSLDISHFDTSKVTNMACMFSHCEFKSLDLSHFDTRNVTDMPWMFLGCQAESIDLSSFDTYKVTNIDDMFEDCQIARIRVRDARIIEQLKKDGFKGEIIRV